MRRINWGRIAQGGSRVRSLWVGKKWVRVVVLGGVIVASHQAGVDLGRREGAATTAQPPAQTRVVEVPAPEPKVTEWQEDGLPPELHLWGGAIERWGEYDGHQGCWVALGDPKKGTEGTSIIMCPDGTVTYS